MPVTVGVGFAFSGLPHTRPAGNFVKKANGYQGWILVKRTAIAARNGLSRDYFSFNVQCRY